MCSFSTRICSVPFLIILVEMPKYFWSDLKTCYPAVCIPNFIFLQEHLHHHYFFFLYFQRNFTYCMWILTQRPTTNLNKTALNFYLNYEGVLSLNLPFQEVVWRHCLEMSPWLIFWAISSSQCKSNIFSPEAFVLMVRTDIMGGQSVGLNICNLCCSILTCSFSKLERVNVVTKAIILMC